MKILAFVVTYNPAEDLLKSNIGAFIDHVDKIIIWENTPIEDRNRYRFLKDDKIEYQGDCFNSISKALNRGWHYAKDNGYDFFLTMDQDSIWQNFEEFKNKVKEINETQFIFAPRIEPGYYGDSPEKKVTWTITSGMLVPVKTIEAIGGYNEDLCIDGIDMDFCLRARNRGFITIILKDGILKQRYGNPQKINISITKFACSNYPPKRLYEIYKSHIYFLFKYRMPFERRLWIMKTCLFTIPIKVVFFEKDKFNKIKSAWWGCFKGFFLVFR